MTTGHKSENELSKLLRPVQPHLEKHGSKIILGLAGVLLVAAAWIYWSRTSAAEAAAGWGELATANGPEDYADVADENPGTPAAAWARLGEANQYVARGVQSSFTDRDASVGSFKKAREAYEKLLNKRGTPREVRERALYGLARLEEAVAGEDTSIAVAAYEKMLSEFPDSVFKEIVESRIERLKDPEVQKFYAWFDAQKPSVADDLLSPKDLPGTPQPGIPGVTPTPGDPLTPSDPIPGAPEDADKAKGPGLPPPTPGDAESNEKGPALPPATPEGEGKSAGEKPAEGAGENSDAEKSGKADGGNQEK